MFTLKFLICEIIKMMIIIIMTVEWDTVWSNIEEILLIE